MTANTGEYAFLKGLVKRVHELNKFSDAALAQSKQIMKSENGGRVTDITDEAMTAAVKNKKAEDELCILIQKIFEKLKADFADKKINPVRYKEYLVDMNHLLTGGGKIINSNLDIKSIIKEIKKTPLN